MVDALVAMMREWAFWVITGCGVLAWWLFGVVIARVLFASTGKPLSSARGAALWALILAVCAVAVATWFLWHDPIQVVAVASAVVILLGVVMFALLRFEPRVENE